jgi:hypothetical protein
MACTGRMASAGNTASAAARRPNGPPRPSFATGTCIGTWAAKAGTRRQSDTHPARESPFDGATARHYSSGEAAGTGANRTASRWKNSILIRRGHVGGCSAARVRTIPSGRFVCRRAASVTFIVGVEDGWALSASLLGRFSKAPQNEPTTGLGGSWLG